MSKFKIEQNESSLKKVPKVDESISIKKNESKAGMKENKMGLKE